MNRLRDCRDCRDRRRPEQLLRLSPPPAAGTGLVAAPPRGWQEPIARLVNPVITEFELRQLSRLHFLKVLDGAPTASVAVHLRRCLTAMSPHGWSRP